MCKATFIKQLRKFFNDVSNLAPGGNSLVFKAIENGTPVAIKVYSKLTDGGRYKRFKEEVLTMKHLAGIEGIVPLLDYALPEKMIECDKISGLEDMAYFTMPLYKHSLTATLNKNIRGIDGIQAVTEMLEIAKIVKELHDRHLAHRDLKPDNVLVDKDGRLLVSDFGLCIDLDKETKRHTPPPELVGAINYRGPEFLRGRLDDADHCPGDIFSLGRMLWALLLDKEPFNLTDFQFEHSLHSITEPILKPLVMRDIIKSATSVDPLRRPTIDQFINYLELWLMKDEPQSKRDLVSKALSSKRIQEMIISNEAAAEISRLHQETVSFVTTQLVALTSAWREAAEELRQRWNIGNSVDIISRNGIDHFGIPELQSFVGPDQEHLGLSVQYNLGTIEEPRVHFSLYIFFDLNDIKNQHYTVAAIYVPPAAIIEDLMPELTYPFQLKPFSYGDADVNQKILKDITDGIASLNAKL